MYDSHVYGVDYLTNTFEKALKLDKRSTIVYAQEKKVDKDAIYPINVVFLFLDKPRAFTG